MANTNRGSFKLTLHLWSYTLWWSGSQRSTDLPLAEAAGPHTVCFMFTWCVFFQPPLCFTVTPLFPLFSNFHSPAAVALNYVYVCRAVKMSHNLKKPLVWMPQPTSRVAVYIEIAIINVMTQNVFYDFTVTFVKHILIFPMPLYLVLM